MLLLAQVLCRQIAEKFFVELDWSTLSGWDKAYTYRTGNIARVVVDALTNPTFIPSLGKPLTEFPIHMIGHSRGASLICEMAGYLQQKGIWVNQLTALDPHPLLYDAPVRVFSNVLFADNYYEKNAGNLIQGQPVDGAHNVNLTNIVTGEGSGLAHSRIHTYYHGTIDLNATTDGDGGTIQTSWYDTTLTPSRPARNATADIPHFDSED